MTFAIVFTVDSALTPLFTDRVDVHKTCLSSSNFFLSAVEKELRLLKPLCHLFDTSFKDGVLPLIWNIANVTAVRKKDQPLIQVIIDLSQ